MCHGQSSLTGQKKGCYRPPYEVLRRKSTGGKALHCFPLPSSVTSFRALLFSDGWSGSLISGWETRPAPNNSSALGSSFPFVCLANPWVLLQLSSTVVLQAEHKVRAVPKEPKVTVEESRFIECFQQLHWLQYRQECLHPSGKF